MPDDVPPPADGYEEPRPGELFGRPKQSKRGKTVAAFLASGDATNETLRLFGGRQWLPCSVMKHQRTPADDDDAAISGGRRYTEQLPEYNASGMATARDGAVKSMHRMNQGSLNGALSRFPQQIGRTVVLLYAETGDVVVDPFAGHNSRMELCVRAGMDYVGFDLSADFMAHNRARADVLRRECRGRSITLYHRDSRDQSPVPDGYGDFTITSPPYYDTEYYGDEPGQLGNCPTYPAFLDEMQKVMDENYRTLKPGAYSAWFINDFCRDGRMYFYHADTIRLGEASGFIAHDIMVVDLGACIREAFVNETRRSKRLPKRHEYGVIFRKPD